MSARALADCSFETPIEQPGARDIQSPEAPAAEIQFQKDIWREYQREAINAGFNTVQATEYAEALSPEPEPVAGVARTASAPVGRSWFYKSRGGVVGRTITSGLFEIEHWAQSQGSGWRGRCGPAFVSWFRPWNPEGR